ncbi:MAG TPA: aldo/keto reductase [Clostridiaceae bacterium]|nr:aldo/keto reductase [Clostridiaceae bacterium]
MKIRKIGNLEVSPIGMGCMAFSHGYGAAPAEDYSIDAIRVAHDFGCTFYDTAEIYGTEQFYPGHNEQVTGKAIKPFRKDVVLATKLFLAPEEFGDNGVDIYGAIKKHVEKSLVNLQTDFIDLYYLHRIHRQIPVEEVASAMGKLIDEGIIRGWGLSQVGGDTLRRAHEVTLVTAVQNLNNMMERDCEEDIFPYALANNIGVVPFSPIASGYLSGKITADLKYEKVDDVRRWVPQTQKENIIANMPILDVLAEFSTRKNATNAQIALAWMLHKYPNCVPIPGSKNRERILENLAAWDVELTDEEFDALEVALASVPLHGHRGHVEFVG